MPTRYVTNLGKPIQPGLGSYVAAGWKERAASIKEEKKGMATLIAQLAQVGMIKPANKAGPNTLPAYGKHWEVVTKPESLSDIRKQQMIDKERKATGEIPMTKYELANAAKNAYLDYLESEDWNRAKLTLQAQHENDPEGYAKAIAAAEKEVYENQYNTLYDLQKQFHPDAFEKDPLPKEPPPLDETGDFLKEEDQKGYLDDISKMGTSIPKIAGVTALGATILNPQGAKTIAKGAAKGAVGLGKSLYPFAKALATGSPYTKTLATTAGKYGGKMLSAPTVASRIGAAANPVLRGYVGGKILGNVAATLTPQDALYNMGGAVQGNPALRAFAHPMRYMTNTPYRQGMPQGMPGYNPGQ